MMNSEGSTTLRLARAWYGVIGAGALLLTFGQLRDAFAPGAEANVPNIAAGLAVGLLMLAAAGWVMARDAVRGGLAWLGIVAGVLPFLVILWIAIQTASVDAVLLALVPTVVAGLAGARMAAARLAA